MTAAPLPVSLRVLPNGRGLEPPQYATAGAAGLDLRAAIAADEPIRLARFARVAVPTGFAIALPDGWEAQIRPRSGLALHHGVSVLNAPGTIDSDYRGEVAAILVNLGERTFEIVRGMRIAQLVVAPVTRLCWNVTESLTASGRDASGFGSTGSH